MHSVTSTRLSVPYKGDSSSAAGANSSSGTSAQPAQLPRVTPPFNPEAGCGTCASRDCNSCGTKKLSELKKTDPELIEKVVQKLVVIQPRTEPSVVAQGLGGPLPIPKCSVANVEKALVQVMLDDLPDDTASFIRSRLSDSPSLNEFLEILSKNHDNPILKVSLQSAGIELSDVQIIVLNIKSSLDPKLHELQQREQDNLHKIQTDPVVQEKFRGEAERAIQQVKAHPTDTKSTPKDEATRPVTQARDTAPEIATSRQSAQKNTVVVTENIQKNSAQKTHADVQKMVQALQELHPLPTQQLTAVVTTLSQVSDPSQRSAFTASLLQLPPAQVQSIVQAMVQLPPQNIQCLVSALNILTPAQIQTFVQLGTLTMPLLQLPPSQAQSIVRVLTQLPPQNIQVLASVLNALTPAQTQSFAQLSPQNALAAIRIMSSLSPTQMQSFVQLFGRLTPTQTTQVITLLIQLPTQLQGKMAILLGNFVTLPSQSTQVLMAILTRLIQQLGVESLAKFLNSLPMQLLKDPQRILELLEKFSQNPNAALKITGRQPEDVANLLHLFANEEDELKIMRKKRLRTQQPERIGFTDVLSRLFWATEETAWKEAADFRTMLSNRVEEESVRKR